MQVHHLRMNGGALYACIKAEDQSDLHVMVMDDTPQALRDEAAHLRDQAAKLSRRARIIEEAAATLDLI